MTLAGEIIEFMFTIPLEWVFERQDRRKRRLWITVTKVIVLTVYVAALAALIAVAVAALR